MSGLLAVEPGEVLYVNVGGTGSTIQGGFNGGGNPGAITSTAAGGGGGATDIRTEPRTFPDSLASRLVIAADGGGAGGTGNLPDTTGGAGGDAGANGLNGSTVAPGIAGMGAPMATAAAGGAAGVSASDNPGHLCDTRQPALAGDLLVGGRGASGYCGTGSGGGGGGGLYGGGGGGAGAVNTSSSGVGNAGGGGGGGGSSLVPEGFEQALADLSIDPYARLAWTLPSTRIDAGPKGRIVKRKKPVRRSFRFSSDSEDVTFECRLDGKPFRPCTSPKRVLLRPGKHTFAVRAIQADGNWDVTPAKRAVKVVKKKKKKKKKKKNKGRRR